MRPTCQRCNTRTVTKAGTKSNGEVRWRHICGPCEGELRRIRSNKATQDAIDLVKLDHEAQISLMNDAVEKLGVQLKNLSAWAGEARPRIGLLESALEHNQAMRSLDKGRIESLESKLEEARADAEALLLERERIEAEKVTVSTCLALVKNEVHDLKRTTEIVESRFANLQQISAHVRKERDALTKTANAQLEAYRDLSHKYDAALLKITESEAQGINLSCMYKAEIGNLKADIVDLGFSRDGYRDARDVYRDRLNQALIETEALVVARSHQAETIKQMTMQNTKLTVKVERLEQDVVELEGVADGLRDALVMAETAKQEALEEADQCHQREINVYIEDQKIAHDDASEATRQWMLARRKMRVGFFLHGFTFLSLVSTLYFLAL